MLDEGRKSGNLWNMPRAMRVEYPGAIYHVMDRGDRQDLLKTLAEACRKTDWQVHAYCLMRNHFHLVVETPSANLVEGMRWFLSAYTIRLNHRQKLFGHVFSGRYKALIVEGSGNGYLKTACDYVHLNPVRAHLLRPEDRLLAYPWSSFGWYLAAPEHRPGWMRVDRLLGEHGIQGDSAAGRQEFERHMEARRLEEVDEEALKPLRRGWCLGSEEFRQKMLGLMEEKLGDNHSGELRRETAEQKANRIIAEELLSRGWKESDLTTRGRSDRGKLAIASRLRSETTLPIKWIAARVHIGTAKGAKSVLFHLARGQQLKRKPGRVQEPCAQLEFQSTV